MYFILIVSVFRVWKKMAKLAWSVKTKMWSTEKKKRIKTDWKKGKPFIYIHWYHNFRLTYFKPPKILKAH